MAPNYVISITGLWICLFTFCLPAHSAERLIIISIDGGRPDVLLRIDTPIIHRLVKTGSFTFWAQTIDLSITLPSHTSMLTGVGPEKHGITWNDYRSSKGTVAVTTVFEIVKNTGRSTAMIVGKEKFKHLNKKGTVDTFIYRDKL
ncbi:MAG: alkaline phosphatase family protein, partial [Pseudomonadota bacterium]